MASKTVVCPSCGFRNSPPPGNHRCASCGAKMESLGRAMRSREEELERRYQQEGFSLTWMLISLIVQTPVLEHGQQVVERVKRSKARFGFLPPRQGAGTSRGAIAPPQPFLIEERKEIVVHWFSLGREPRTAAVDGQGPTSPSANPQRGR